MPSNRYVEPGAAPLPRDEDIRATLSVGKRVDAAKQSLLLDSEEPTKLSRISISVATEYEAETALPIATAKPEPSRDRQVAPEPPKPAAFVITRPVGTGGHGEVHEALQTSLGRIVAVKRIREEVYRSHSAKLGGAKLVEADFHQEALVAGALEHPNIVPVHDFGADENGRPLLAMKLIKGKSWDDLIEEQWVSGLPPAEFLNRNLRILQDVAQAVAFAHSRGIVHRDLKPSQVMVGEFGETVLMDWGLAIFYGSSAHHFSLAQHTLAQALPTPANASNPAGTPAFMAPEQTRDSATEVGPWTDVFLLGGTLYYLLTGTTPFACESVVATMDRASVCDFVPPQVRVNDREIPLELAQLCLRCMMPKPEDRLGSASEFIREITNYLSGSSKRSESVAITDSVHRTIADPSLGYKDFAEALAQLANARGLWDQNERVIPQMDYVRERYARMALKEGDLSLAAAQTALISNEKVRETLTQLQGKEEKAASHKRRAALYFQYSSIILLIVLLFIGFSHRGFGGSVTRLGEELARLIELGGNVRRLDESMTLSAMMAATTGEPQWAERHAELAEQFDAALHEIGARHARANVSYALDNLMALKIGLIDQERQALDLVAKGSLAEARAILNAKEYQDTKQGLNVEVGRLFLNTQQAVTDLIDREEAVRRTSGNALIGVVGLVTLLWMYQVGLAHRVARIRDRALQAIER